MKSQISRTVTFWTIAAFVSFGVGTGLAGQSQTEAAPGQSGSPAPLPTTESSPDQSDSRIEELKARRRAQAGKSREKHLSGFERGLAEMEKTRFYRILNFNYRGLYPQFATLSTGSGFAPGARFWRPNIAGLPLDLQASGAYSFNGYQRYGLQFGHIQKRGSSFSLEGVGIGAAAQFDEATPKEPGFFLYGDLTYRFYPQEDFFGLGPSSLDADRTDFLQEDMSYDAVGGWQVNRWLGAAVRVGYLQVNVNRGTDGRFPDTQDLFTDLQAPGLDRQPDFLDITGAVLIDYRDRPGNPHKGGMIGFYLSRHDERKGHEFEFKRAALDIRQFIPLFSEQRVIAVRFFTSADDADNGSRIPFFLEEHLGGSETLRGFREFRFRDQRLMYLSAEYRWEAAHFLELALFYDTGKVFSQRSDFKFDNMEKSIGGGIRFKTPHATVLRIDMGRSDEGNRFFFKFGPSF